MFSDIRPNILSNTYSGILAPIFSSILSGVHSDILFGILSSLYSRILSGISSDILSDILSDTSSGCICGWGLAGSILILSSPLGSEVQPVTLRSSVCCPSPVWKTSIERSQWKSSAKHSDLEFAARARRGTQPSTACNWGPAGITLMLGLLFGSGRNHCDLALALEVWLRQFGSWICFSGPAKNIAIARLQLNSGGADNDVRLGEDGTADLESNNTHLARGKIYNPKFCGIWRRTNPTALQAGPNRSENSIRAKDTKAGTSTPENPRLAQGFKAGAKALQAEPTVVKNAKQR